MKIIEFIDYLINPKLLEGFYIENKVNEKSEAIIIYMQSSLELESEIFLFEIEETEDDLIYEKNGITYIQLFPIDYAVNLIDTDLQLKNKGYSNEQIAVQLLQYRIKDA